MTKSQTTVTVAMAYTGALVMLHTDALGKFKSLIQTSSGIGSSKTATANATP